MGGLVSLAGCHTIRKTLQPQERDCDANERIAQECSHEEREADPASSVAHSRRVAHAAHDRAQLASKDELAESGEPAYRDLERGDDQKEEPDRDPLEPIDPTAETPVVDDDDREELGQEYNVDLDDDDLTVFEGNFSVTEDGEELVVIEQTKRMTVYSPRRKLTELELEGEAGVEAFEELGFEADQLEPRAVRLVNNDTFQVLIFWREEGEEDELAYKVAAFKPIGEFIARIFERTLATRAEDDEELQRHGTFEVLRGDDNRFVRWIPADEDGELQTDQADILEWNEWEGVYRVPKPPPTAPDDEELRSALHPAMAVSAPN